VEHEPINPVPVDDFARNLRILCTTHRSVSEVCRLTGINRQQFGRYLNGTYRPSRHNLRRICDILDVHESDLTLPASQFETLLNSHVSEMKLGGGAGWLGRRMENLVTTSDPGLRKYLGWYHSYSYSFGWPKWIIRSLVHVYDHQGRVLSKRIERLKNPIHDERFIYKADGLVTMSADRIFIAEHDSLQQDGFSIKILFRTHRSHVNFLSGLVTGTSSRPDRLPTSARVVLEYLGRTIDTRAELRKCGMFPASQHNINPKILSLIDNSFAEGETALHAIAR
jgi:transcriptional regulator with XRE-family HTH domain